jgi:cell division protein FtsN
MVSGMNDQRGGFAIGLVVGVLIGLALALAVAVYVTKVPLPFVDKVPQRHAGQDAADAEKNRNWDPNALLAGKAAARSASGVIDAASAVVTSPIQTAPTAAPANTATPAAAPAPAPADTTARGGNAPAAAPVAAATEAAGQFLVQVGAYARTDDAEQQRAKLAIAGLTARVSERDQSGKVVYRVRLGPYVSRDEADAAREQAVAAGYAEATVMRAR